jgi:hypothetical protein
METLSSLRADLGEDGLQKRLTEEAQESQRRRGRTRIRHRDEPQTTDELLRKRIGPEEVRCFHLLTLRVEAVTQGATLEALLVSNRKETSGKWEERTCHLSTIRCKLKTNINSNMIHTSTTLSPRTMADSRWV